jgi:hypothetical protein
MKLDVEYEEFEGLFRDHKRMKELERQLFAHVREARDLRVLSGLEQVLYCVLSEEIDDNLAMDLCRVMVARAAEDVIRDPARDMTTVPHGISRAERIAAFYEDDCVFCEAKVNVLEDEEVDDDCECCRAMVREWRAKHAVALARYRPPRSKVANG